MELMERFLQDMSHIHLFLLWEGSSFTRNDLCNYTRMIQIDIIGVMHEACNGMPVIDVCV